MGQAAIPDQRTGATGGGIRGTLEDQFGLRQLISEYLIPVETNTIWYILGGVLGMAIALEILTGVLISFKYLPDASRAYFDTYAMLHSRGWRIMLSFHYFNAFLIFGLVMLHMMRVFISGGYRRGKQGLWLVGVGLAGLALLAVVTGESLHWDEVGFAVPWHVSEVFQAIPYLDLANRLPYRFADMKSIHGATVRLQQIYVIHVAIVPIVLVLVMLVHYYLIRAKGISLPFWHTASGRKAPFSEHIRAWLLYGGLILGAILLMAIFIHRGAGTQPQLLPTSPLYGAKHGPGGLGYKPSFPISWTHGMNVFVDEKFGLTPDIWGSMIGTALLVGSLLLIPFLDRSDHEPKDAREAFDWRKRGLAFLAIVIFWTIMIVGIWQNAVAGAG